MANYRLGGPTDTSNQTLLLEDGTLGRSASGAPGAVEGALPGQSSDWDPVTLWRRAVCVQEAYGIGLRHAPEAIVRETGYQLAELLKGLLPGLLMMMGVIGVTTAIGGAAGAAIGALAGGVGAAPGAAVGAKLGMDVGAALLMWMGLGFLVVAIGRGLGEVSGMVLRAVTLAWEAHGTPQRQRDVEAAGQLFADAVAKLFLLILMAIVARLTLGQARSATANAAASVDELVAALRSSRLGAGFADWVAANAQSLMRNPRLRQHNEVGGSAAGDGSSVTPSQMRAANPPTTPAPSPTPPSGPGAFANVNESMSARASAYQRHATGTPQGSGYVVNGVKFDGYANGTLLEAKSNYAQFVRDGQFRSWFGGADEMVAQAQRQLAVANGTPIQWRFAEQSAADAARSLFQQRGISGIDIIHFP